ncbi:hypothetical protein MMC29_005277, partial [Sticta canariensis]|nr:hypothetical protein [Sticta canariensis]
GESRRRRDADSALTRALQANAEATEAMAEATRRPAPPVAPPLPVGHPQICARCAKAGPKAKCHRSHKFAKCDYCKRWGEKCLPIPEEMWPSARRQHTLNKAARHSQPPDPEKWAEAEESAKVFGKELNALNRHLRKENPGGPAENVSKDLLGALRLTNQLLLNQALRSYYSNGVFVVGLNETGGIVDEHGKRRTAGEKDVKGAG